MRLNWVNELNDWSVADFQMVIWTDQCAFKHRRIFWQYLGYAITGGGVFRRLLRSQILKT